MITVILNPPELNDQQIRLRSTANKSAKSPIILTRPTPLSSEEFNQVISGMRKTQNATLAQCEALSLSFNKKFCELQSSVDSLASQIFDIRADNTSLRTELATLNDRIRVRVIESDVDTFPTSSGDNILQLFQELSDREIRSHNVIVHGLKESAVAIPTGRLAKVIQHLSVSIEPLTMSLSTSRCYDDQVGSQNWQEPSSVKCYIFIKDHFPPVFKALCNRYEL